MKTVFVFAYYSYKDPVFQSAVLPYLQLNHNETRFVILTWEQKKFALQPGEIDVINDELQKQNIIWKRTYWHSGSLKAIKKIFDFIWGVVISLRIIVKYKATVIYTEGFPGALISFVISKITTRPHIIHTFEPHADYMLEAGVWTSSSWEYQLLKKAEILIANQATTIITATQAYANVLRQKGVTTSIVVLPSCTDTRFYKFLPVSRNKIRAEFGARDGQIVIAYLGKMGGMYMEEEIFEFIHACQNYQAGKFVFLLFTSEDGEKIKKWNARYNIDERYVFSRFLSKEEVPAHLSACDFGFVAVRPKPSKRFCSPIKTGEYLACGLPVIIPNGISDDYQEIARLGLGITYDIEEPLTNVVEAVLNFGNTVNSEKLKAEGSAFVKRTRDLEMGRQKLSAIFDLF